MDRLISLRVLEVICSAQESIIHQLVLMVKILGVAGLHDDIELIFVSVAYITNVIPIWSFAETNVVSLWKEFFVGDVMSSRATAIFARCCRYDHDISKIVWQFHFKCSFWPWIAVLENQLGNIIWEIDERWNYDWRNWCRN